MEYLKEDFKLYEEEEEYRVLSCGVILVLEFEIGSEVRGKESESESFTRLGLEEKQVKKNKDNRSMQSETEEARAIGKQREEKDGFFFPSIFSSLFFLNSIRNWEECV